MNVQIREASISDAERLAPLVQKLWPEHEIEALVRIVGNYIRHEESAVFMAAAEDRLLGLALCSLRHD